MTTETRSDAKLARDGNSPLNTPSPSNSPPPYPDIIDAPSFSMSKQENGAEVIDNLTSFISESTPIELGLLVEQLKFLQIKAKSRHFWTQVSCGFNGFIDGMFDIGAPFGISGALASGILGVGLAVSLLTPPFGWVVFASLVGVGILFGAGNVYHTVKRKNEELDTDNEKFQEAIDRINALKNFKKNRLQKKTFSDYINEQELKALQSIEEKFSRNAQQRSKALQEIKVLYCNIRNKLIDSGVKSVSANTIEQSSDNKSLISTTTAESRLTEAEPNTKDKANGSFIDKLDSGSRHGRNAVMLSYFITQPLLALIGVTVTWPIIVASFGLFLIQAIPRYLERIWIDEPRDKEQDSVDQILKQTKTANEVDIDLAKEHALGIELELETANIISAALIDTPHEDSLILREHNDNIKLTDFNNPENQSLTEISEYKKISKANKSKSMRYARGIAFAHGILHPVAWITILGLVIGLAGGPIGVGVVIGGIALAALISLYVAPKLAERATFKEREAQEKQDRAIKNYETAVKNCQKKIESIKTTAETTKTIHTREKEKLNLLFEIYYSNLNDIQDLPTRYGQQKKLEALHAKFMSEREAKLLEIAVNDKKFSEEVSTISQPTNSSVAWPTLQKGMRDFRDSFGFWEKPLTAVNSVMTAFTEIAGYAGGVIISAGLGLLTLVPAIIKKNMDNTRDTITKDCEEKAAHLILAHTQYLSNKFKLQAEINRLEKDFKESASNMLDNSWITTPEISRSASRNAERPPAGTNTLPLLSLGIRAIDSKTNSNPIEASGIVYDRQRAASANRFSSLSHLGLRSSQTDNTQTLSPLAPSEIKPAFPRRNTA